MGYECWGGPMDGEIMSIPPGHSEARIYMSPSTMSGIDPQAYFGAGSIKIRTGLYRVQQRREDHRCYLVWQGEE